MKIQKMDMRSFARAILAALILLPFFAHSAQANSAALSLDVDFEGVALITNLTATPGPGGDQITLQWTGPAYNGANFPLAYSVVASTGGNILNTAAFKAAQSLSVFTSSFTLPSVSTGVVQSMIVGKLTTGDLYCFALRAQDSAVPVNIGAWLVNSAKGYNVNNCAYPLVPRIPLEPIGISISTSATSATISWQAVTHFADGGAFAISTAPMPIELTGYRVFSTTAPTGAPWSEISGGSGGLLSTATLSWSDLAIAPPRYYYVASENLSGDSVSSNLRAFPSGDLWVVAYDSMSTIDIPDAYTAPLSNYYISSSSTPLQLNSGVFKTVTFTALLNGLTPQNNLVLGGMADLSLHYSVASGQVSASALSPKGVGVAPVPQNSSTFWFNGNTWVQLFVKIDTVNQVLFVQTPYLGQYQLRTAERATSFSFNMADISNREITPTVPGKNNTVEFLFDNPKYSAISGKIYDLRGRPVSGMNPCSDQPVSQCLMWDAKSNGRVVPGGIYVYVLRGEGKTFSGTVIVIR